MAVPANLPWGAKKQKDADRAAQTAANEAALPMTVYHGRVDGFSYTNATLGKELRDERNRQCVTWLPQRYFA